MNICVINASPKPSQYSVTYQTVLYLQKRYPQHHYETIDVGPKIRSLEKDPSPALESMARYPCETRLINAARRRKICAW